MVEQTIDLQQVRRDLHAIPELSLHEVKTKAYLKKLIESLGCSFLETREVPALPTALLVRLKGKNPKKTIGYRADIDALPIEEKTGLPFASSHPGQMHACGHDIHMTVALGILAYFASHQPNDNLVFVFQPAEEEHAGGKQLYESGALSGDFLPDEIYALHDQPALPSGQVATLQGTLFAGTTEIHLTVRGQGGHAAYPHQAKDAVVAAAAFVSQVQSVVSRSVNPIHGGVVTIGSFHAGTIGNVIAGEAQLEGTIRAFTQVDLTMMQERVQAISDGIALSYGVTMDLELEQGGYYPVENDPAITADFINFMAENPDIDFAEAEPAMTGEDFGYLLQKIPGTMFWLGVGDPDHSLHDARLNPDEGALDAGVKAMIAYLEWRMAENQQNQSVAM
ncbi:N-acetyldiaminopimelate deacetylase [Fructobacillus pseudoficulneus]|uniref:N-acetyldiaminopimelate deacetylase n=1 Tax=Fructobacillus pseudoficulneus TaxID=220714 RepID=A0A3F3GT57_9LACO|nr:N-acetyldiaminopimelate deacetylase [Fructobacillus pseudoficulneus]GAP02655.1 N-acetyldiaminopimelate deacetylase [Fructobacillus pseudoficulneus]SEH38840.1 N-acetyldiaminopimelate deacetylase [Fructobacillus pseudoficulneus]